ncbi:MAG: (2Fe-2S)-binding protein [Candidatus Saccharibacteria bacterium]|nr:(2Fe-2S)-binding protein [Microbacteriaceae bacterium]
MTGRRLASGGDIDRAHSIDVEFDGVSYRGYRGDTLASALLGAGVMTIGSSVRLGRARGVVSAGTEESSAIVQIEFPFPEPMLQATTVELVEGLKARGITGQGRLATTTDPARYDARHVHCDILIVGAGPAGLSAALVAARAGARVILIDDDRLPGGSLLDTGETIDATTGTEWAASVLAELEVFPRVRVLSRTTAFGVYEDGFVLALEHRTDHLGASADPRKARQRVWRIRTEQIVVATGGYERSIAFTDNDLPGVMLASSALTYLHRFAVLAGERVVITTTNDTAYRVAFALADAGATVTIVDTRSNVSESLARLCLSHGVESRLAQVVIAALGSGNGDGSVAGALVGQWPASAASPIALDCDLILVSGGWSPVLHLYSQARGTLAYDDVLATFVAAEKLPGVQLAGLAAAQPTLAAALLGGAHAAAAALAALGFPAPSVLPQPIADGSFTLGAVDPVWSVPAPDGLAADTRFVDVQRDVTVSELVRAVGAGLASMEHIKRFTTLGTALDQGKTSGLLGSGVVSQELGIGVAELGTTKFRPPFSPVAFGALAGTDRGDLYDPIRLTSIHNWHLQHGAVFEDVGQWKRPRFYPLAGEDMDSAVSRECRAARTAVACMDGSTLGKIDVTGPDAAEFLDLLYTNMMSSLKVDSIRYGVMCSPDGMVKDDGTVIRLAEHHFIVTTTTGNAATILDWMEEWLQTEWPHLRVSATSVTEHWATIPLVGPLSRAVLERLVPALDVSVAGFPFMTTRAVTILGVAGRVDRISFSGELAYELNVPAWFGQALWEAVMAAGEEHDITPYGTEAMHVLRAEKGYPIIGQDTDGTISPHDLGLGWAVSKNKPDFIGKRSFARADNSRIDRKNFVGLLPVDPTEAIPEGAQLVESDGIVLPMPMLGYVTSAYRSDAIGSHFALALLSGGRERLGQRLFAWDEGRIIPVTVAESVLYDPEGSRRDG